MNYDCLVPKEDKQHFFLIIISTSASSFSLSTYVNDNLINKFSLPIIFLLCWFGSMPGSSVRLNVSIVLILRVISF